MGRFSQDGFWWFPGQRETRAAGRLYETERGGFRLELLKSLAGISDLQLIGGVKHYPIIQGLNEKGKPVTLLGCGFSSSSAMLSAGVSKERYSVDMVLVGEFLTNESLLFCEANLGLTGLSNWLNRCVLSEGAPASLDTAAFQYKRPPDIEMVFPRGTLKILSAYETKLDYFNQFEVSYTPIIQITLNEPMDVDAWETMYLRPLRNFLTFSSRHVVYLSQLGLSWKAEAPSSNKPVEIEVVLPDSEKRSAPVEYLHPHAVLFNGRDVGEHLGKILAKWLDLSQELDNVMSLFFAPVYNEHMYLEHQFLNLAYAAETYHRQRFPGGFWSDEKFEAIREQAICPFQGSERKWIKARLRHANEPSFRDRIISLWSMHCEPLKMFPVEIPQFAEKVAKTRNYYVHFDDSQRGQEARGEALFRMLQLLQSLMEVCLLSELGFTEKEISTLMLRNENLKFTARSVKERPGLFD